MKRYPPRHNVSMSPECDSPIIWHPGTQLMLGQHRQLVPPFSPSPLFLLFHIIEEHCGSSFCWPIKQLAVPPKLSVIEHSLRCGGGVAVNLLLLRLWQHGTLDNMDVHKTHWNFVYPYFKSKIYGGTNSAILLNIVIWHVFKHYILIVCFFLTP